MDYVTSDGAVLRTGYKDTQYWYILVVKELLDNAVDFLWKHYQGSDKEVITISITKSDKLIHIKVTNTNAKDFPVFQKLELILDYDMRYGSKQNEFVISRGMLGDAMKQILSFGYVLTHINDQKEQDALVDKQWKHPLVIRHNRQEFNVYLHVDKAKEEIAATIKDVGKVKNKSLNTKIEVTLPVTNDLMIADIARFCTTYPLLTTDISFNFRLVDNSSVKAHKQTDSFYEAYEEVDVDVNAAPELGLMNILKKPEPKAAIVIEYPALHPISREWNNTSSISYYKKEEVLTRLVRVHDKTVTVHDVLRTTREGSNLSKTKETSITIAELISDKQREKRVEKLYYQLKSTLSAPTELSLPYRTTTQSKRREAIVNRIMRIYPELDQMKQFTKQLTESITALQK